MSAHLQITKRTLQKQIHRTQTREILLEFGFIFEDSIGHGLDVTKAQVVAVSEVPIICFEDDCLVQLVHNHLQAAFCYCQLAHEPLQLSSEVNYNQDRTVLAKELGSRHEQTDK